MVVTAPGAPVEGVLAVRLKPRETPTMPTNRVLKVTNRPPGGFVATHTFDSVTRRPDRRGGAIEGVPCQPRRGPVSRGAELGMGGDATGWGSTAAGERGTQRTGITPRAGTHVCAMDSVGWLVSWPAAATFRLWGPPGPRLRPTIWATLWPQRTRPDEPRAAASPPPGAAKPSPPRSSIRGHLLHPLRFGCP